MEELKFNCPAYLAQRFWLHCAEREQTPGQLLREFMVSEISCSDSAFEFDLKTATGQDTWSVTRGDPRRSG